MNVDDKYLYILTEEARRGGRRLRLVEKEGALKHSETLVSDTYV